MERGTDREREREQKDHPIYRNTRSLSVLLVLSLSLSLPSTKGEARAPVTQSFKLLPVSLRAGSTKDTVLHAGQLPVCPPPKNEGKLGKQAQNPALRATQPEERKRVKHNPPLLRVENDERGEELGEKTDVSSQSRNNGQWP